MPQSLHTRNLNYQDYKDFLFQLCLKGPDVDSEAKPIGCSGDYHANSLFCATDQCFAQIAQQRSSAQLIGFLIYPCASICTTLEDEK